MLAATSDVHFHVQPRHVHRRQRHPGARERNSTRRLRLQSPETPRMTSQSSSPRPLGFTQHHSTYSYESAVSDLYRRVPRTEIAKPVQENLVVSKCPEPKTVEEIRKSMERTARPISCPPGSTRRPEWITNLDINLDMSAVDLVPAYGDKENADNKNVDATDNPYLSASFTESALFKYLDTENEDDENDDCDINRIESNNTRVKTTTQNRDENTNIRFQTTNNPAHEVDDHTLQMTITKSFETSASYTHGKTNDVNRPNRAGGNTTIHGNWTLSNSTIRGNSTHGYSTTHGNWTLSNSTTRGNSAHGNSAPHNKTEETSRLYTTLGTTTSQNESKDWRGTGTLSESGRNTFRTTRPLSAMSTGTGPRRYQGDKKVMSMQQGGIRSTPFQPKSKKYINQMIAFNHMKHHERKLKIAKPAVDTKMPSTFKYALDRKRLVEQRVYDSMKEIEAPTQSQTSLSESTSYNNKTPTDRRINKSS